MIAEEIIVQELSENEGIRTVPGAHGYWSNLDIDENRQFLRTVKDIGSKQAVEKCFPQYIEVIFSPKRAGGMIFLDPRPDDIVVDFGCMWGALTVPLARAGCKVVAIDQTRESLLFLKERLVEEGLDNVELVCSRLGRIEYKERSFDKAVVNGVLEWLPETGEIELKKCFGKKTAEKPKNYENPYKVQLEFLKKVYRGLKNGGVLYLAIENRFDIFHFFGIPDPHCNLKFITIMPRPLQHLMSKLFLKRPYLNWIHSPGQLKKILLSAGFKEVGISYAFPDYRFPECVISSNSMNIYLPYRFKTVKNGVKRLICYCIEVIFFRILRLYVFSPSIVALARK